VSDLSARKSDLLEELHRGRSKLELWKQPADAVKPEASPSETRVRHSLSDAEVNDMNRAGAWLKATQSQSLLGSQFKRALKEDQPEALAGGTIGRPGGLDAPIAELHALIDASERFLQASTITSTTRLLQLATIIDAADNLRLLA